MKIQVENIVLPEGEFNCELQFFDKSDVPQLRALYDQWNQLSSLLEEHGGRRLNIPELISEAIYCLNFESGRKLNFKTGNKVKNKIKGANTSFDCFNIKTQKRIQVKACSVESDLTSFGPKSVWDEIYFVHFFPNNKYDGSYDIYLINNEDIYNHKVNKNQTLREQQKAGKRPRFSIIDALIKPNNIKPIISSKL